jgi:hypothetical protein
MSLQLGPTRVVAPDGVEWRVCRRWLTRNPKLRRPSRSRVATESVNHLGASWPDFGGIDLGEGLLVAAAVVALLLILIPVVFFGIELIVLGVLLAAGVIARTVLGQPWVIEARSADAIAPERRLEWRVRGWRESAKLITRVASDLSAGRDPDARGRRPDR